MGAIAGYFSWSQPTQACRRWSDVSKRLAEFGSAGLAVENLDDGKIAHAYNDVETDDPICHSDCGRFTAVASVRLDNREQLLSQLGQPSQLSDAAILLAMYVKLGESGFCNIIGDFNVIIFDRRDKQFIAIRDRVGVRPLFYHHSDGAFYFATTLALLNHLLGGVPELDTALLGATESGLVVRHDDTIWRGCYRLLPASVLRVTGNQADQTRYWTLSTCSLSANSETTGSETDNSVAADYSERIRCALQIAVRSRMRRTKVTGILLSGGLDSSSIAHLADHYASASGKKVITASAIIPDRYQSSEQDEQRYIDAVRSKCNFHKSLLEKNIGTDPLNRESHIEAISMIGTPMNLFHAMDHALHSRLAKSGAQVALNGFGGDFTVSYHDSNWLFRCLLQLQWREALSTFPAMSKFTATPLWRLVVRQIGLMTKSIFTRILPRPRKSLPFYSTNLQARLAIDRLKRENFDPATTISRLLHSGSASAEEVYAQASRLGIEASFPFLDIRLLSVTAVLPRSEFVKDGMPRSLLRRAMWDFLPDSVRNRTTKGRYVPGFASGVLERTTELLQELQSIPPPIEDQIKKTVNTDRLRQLLDDCRSQRSSVSLSSKQVLDAAQAFTLVRFLREHYGRGQNKSFE